MLFLGELLKELSNKLVDEIKWCSKKKKSLSIKEVKEGRIKEERTDEKNENYNKMIFKHIYIGNYVKFKWIKYFSRNKNIVRLFK